MLTVLDYGGNSIFEAAASSGSRKMFEAVLEAMRVECEDEVRRFMFKMTSCTCDTFCSSRRMLGISVSSFPCFILRHTV